MYLLLIIGCWTIGVFAVPSVELINDICFAAGLNVEIMKDATSTFITCINNTKWTALGNPHERFCSSFEMQNCLYNIVDSFSPCSSILLGEHVNDVREIIESIPFVVCDRTFQLYYPLTVYTVKNKMSREQCSMMMEEKIGYCNRLVTDTLVQALRNLMVIKKEYQFDEIEVLLIRLTFEYPRCLYNNLYKCYSGNSTKRTDLVLRYLRYGNPCGSNRYTSFDKIVLCDKYSFDYEEMQKDFTKVRKYDGYEEIILNKYCDLLGKLLDCFSSVCEEPAGLTGFANTDRSVLNYVCNKRPFTWMKHFDIDCIHRIKDIILVCMMEIYDYILPIEGVADGITIRCKKFKTISQCIATNLEICNEVIANIFRIAVQNMWKNTPCDDVITPKPF